MVTQPIRIRMATAADVPFLQAMMWEAIRASPGLVAARGEAALRAREAVYWGGWAAAADPAYVAVDATGQPLGALTLKADGPGTPPPGWRLGLGVAAAARRQGVGRRLLMHALHFARAEGAAYLSLRVDPANAPALALYRQLGFEPLPAGVGPVDEMRVTWTQE